MAFKRRWQPTASQKREYAERMRAIESEQSNVPSGYEINCTGDVCTGDEITFFNAGKDGAILYGKVISESYGKDKQQHTFKIETDGGETMLIKGRNLYKNGVNRKRWADENERKRVLDEKHERGAKARAARDKRKSENNKNS